MRATICALFVLGLAVVSLPGCGPETATVKQESTTTTPGGTTKTTIEKKVEKTGDNPPPANP